jgi:hypothetical protein
MSFDPPGYPFSTSTYTSTYDELPSHHLRSTLDLLAMSPILEHVGYEAEDDLDLSLDFSRLHDPRAMRQFLTTCDYYISEGSNDYNSNDEGYDLTWECFHTKHEEHREGNQLGMPRYANAPTPAPHAGEPRERGVVQTHEGSQIAHLKQLRKLHAKLG